MCSCSLFFTAAYFHLSHCRYKIILFFFQRIWCPLFFISRSRSFSVIHVNLERLEILRLKFFGISREPRTLRYHVSRALPSGLRVVRLDHAPEATDLPQSFWHPKTSQSHV